MEPSGSTISSSSNHPLNSTGGVCQWEVSDKAKLCRFLCYGSYTLPEEGRVSMEHAGALVSMLQEGRGAEVVEEIKRFSQQGRAVTLDPSWFALALCSQQSELKTRQVAFKALKEVCRDPAHLFSFIQQKKELREDPGGSTDCTLPISWATESGKAADVFIILTNNPVWTFTASPVPSLKKHRHQSGANSKMVMCGLTSIRHAITDTEDRGLVSICGFNLGTFSVIRNLAQDLI
ncbi:hypothetical protein CesoFtcFv8_014621 [Champsocephalus esox]|uniref:RNA-binding protein RO60 vWA domain-containing protein n=1 Tax=Champsocephalus esox TaxID=159716 RepID=A0AAN8BP56_9TELE|nr:hypothetical protein CesoFtcFv8_014621 [Champsocephalus esox]